MIGNGFAGFGGYIAPALLAAEGGMKWRKRRTVRKCAGAMVDGFIADQTHGGANAATWREGEPKKTSG